MREVTFKEWPIYAGNETGEEIPYLDIEGEDEPIDFLFTHRGGNYFARGTINTIKGREKEGKSAAGIVFVVAALKEGGFMEISPTGSKISTLWVDTEQDRATLRQRAKGALSMAGAEHAPDRLKIVTLLETTDTAKRLQTVERVLQEVKPDFVLLDGIVDLCGEFNDEVKSREVVEALARQADAIGCCIACIIHTNKKDDEARGHLGAILQQKSACIYVVEKNGDTATLKEWRSRYAPTPKICYRFANGFTLEAAESPEALKQEQDKQELNELFCWMERKGYTHGQLCKELVSRNGISSATAKRKIKEAVESSTLFHSGTVYSYLFPADCSEENGIKRQYQDEEDDEI